LFEHGLALLSWYCQASHFTGNPLPDKGGLFRRYAGAVRRHTKVEKPSSEMKNAKTFKVLALCWWRRRESNPRPKILYSKFYILSPVIWF